MAVTRRFTKPVVPEEQLDETVSELLAYARAQGLKMRREAGRADAPRRAPRVSSLIRDDLRSMLEDEIVVTVEAGQENGIDETEFGHEVSKKALVGLKAKQLKDAAKELGVAARGQAEDLAEAIARHYMWDEQQIALFILQHLDEPNEATAHMSRVFALDKTELDAEVTRERLSEVKGRYIRTDVAKWFVFNTVQSTSATAIAIDGSYLAYSVGIDELGGSPKITPNAKVKHVHAVFDLEAMWVRVDNSPIQAARTAAKAIAAIARTGLRGYVPYVIQADGDESAGLHETADFFLDMLYNRLPSIGVEDVNLTLIRFEIEKESAGASSDDKRPALRQIRFEGSRLLDSVAACRILANDRRPIANMAMRLSYKPEVDKGAETFPLSMALESDHFAVTTGIGLSGSTRSVDLHKHTVRLATEEMQSGSSNPAKLVGLIKKIQIRANEDHDPESADILLDDETEE